MQLKIILCPKCRSHNAPGETMCRLCGTRICLKCHSIISPQLRVCPECGWRDPHFKLPDKTQAANTQNEGTSEVITKKLDFKCPQCGTNVKHEATKCPVCGHIGVMQLREIERKSPATRTRQPQRRKR